MNLAIPLCLNDGRFIDYQDALLGMVESSLFKGPIYFNYNTNLTIKVKEKNILKALELEVKLHNLVMLLRSYPATILIRMYYKTLNTLDHIGAINR